MNKIALVSIIDDDKFFQFSTKKLLELSQKVDNILQFHDGEEAIEYFIENKDHEQMIAYFSESAPSVSGQTDPRTGCRA